MSEEQVSKKTATSDNIKMSLSAEGEIAKKDIAMGVAGMFALKNIISTSPEMASAFKAALGAGQAQALAAKVLATDDVSRVVTQLSSTDEVLNVVGNLPIESGQFFSKLGHPLVKLIGKGGSRVLNGSETSNAEVVGEFETIDTTDIENELGTAFAESEGFFEEIVFADIAWDAVGIVTDVVAVTTETSVDAFSAITEFFSSFF